MNKAMYTEKSVYSLETPDLALFIFSGAKVGKHGLRSSLCMGVTKMLLTASYQPRRPKVWCRITLIPRDSKRTTFLAYLF